MCILILKRYCQAYKNLCPKVVERKPEGIGEIINMQTPIPHRPVLRPEDVPRNVFCAHYGSCLDYALEMKWKGFSCEACRAYQLEKDFAEKAMEDALRCSHIVYLIQNPEAGYRAHR